MAVCAPVRERAVRITGAVGAVAVLVLTGCTGQPEPEVIESPSVSEAAAMPEPIIHDLQNYEIGS